MKTTAAFLLAAAGSAAAFAPAQTSKVRKIGRARLFAEALALSARRSSK